MATVTQNLYFDRVDSTLGTGSRLRTTTVGLTNGTVASGAPVSTAVQFSTPLPTRGGVPTVTGSTTRPQPNGTGWFLEDSTTMTGKRIYNDASITATVAMESFSGLVDAAMYLRFWRYDTVAGTYTYIGELSDFSTTFRNSVDAVFSGSLGIGPAFTSTDRLYVDCVWYFLDTSSTARTVNLRSGDGVGTIALRLIDNSDLAPANDPLTGAIELTDTATGQLSASNLYASYEEGEMKNGPDGDGVVYNKVYGGLGMDGPGSLWWKYTVPDDGSAPEFLELNCFGTLTTSTTDGETGQFVRLDTRLRVFTSSTPLTPTHASLTLVAENDDSGSYLPFSSEGSNAKITIESPTPGETYFVQVMCQTRGAQPDDGSGGSFSNLRIGLLRLNWIKLWRGAYNEPTNLVYDNTDLATIGSWGSSVDGGFDSPFHQTKQYHGYTSIWGFAGYPSPHSDPDAYWLASLRCHCGDQSIDETGNNTEIGWDPPNTWLPGAYRLNGTQIWDMGGSNQYSGVGDGSGAAGADIASGGHASILPPGGGAGALCNWETSWGFSVFNPIGLAFDPNVWEYQGSLPEGASGVVYSKHCADIVSFKVRPAAQGSSAHPASGTFGQTIVGEWWELPNNSPTAPEWGLYRNSGGTLVCRTNTPHGGWPIGLPGDMRTMAGTQKIGEVTFVSGTRTAITTAWTEPPEFQYVALADDDVFDASCEYYAGFAVDFVLDDETMGYQGGTPTWSFTRRIEGQDLEFEIELRPPCYAFLYPSELVATDDCPGLVIPQDDTPPPLRLVQRDDDNGLNTDASQTPRLIGTGGVQRASSEQRSRYPRIQTRNEKGYR